MEERRKKTFLRALDLVWVVAVSLQMYMTTKRIVTDSYGG